MATITWRDVTAPDFRGVQDGYRNFAELMNNAFGAASKGLQQFDNAQSDQVNTNLLADVAAAQNEEQAKTLLAGLASRPDARRLSPETIKFAMGRPGALLEQAGKESDLAFTDWTRNNIKTDAAALDAASPALNKAALLVNSGDVSGAAKVLADSPETQHLDFNQFTKSIRDLQGISSTDTSNRASRFNYDTNVRDDGEARQIDALSGIVRMHGVAPADFDKYVTDNYDALLKQGISATVIERARKAVINDPTAAASFYENGTLGGGGGVPGGGDATTVANYEARAAGIAGIPSTVKTLGDWSNWASGVNNQGVKSSAAGIYQITGDTLREFAPKVLGANWQSQPFTAGAQDAIGKAIFESTKGSPQALMKRWTSLNAAEAQAISRMPWEQARNVIAQGESGATNVSALIAGHTQDVLAQAGPQYNRSQDEGQVTARAVTAAFSSDADVRTVAAQIAGKDGPLAGENLGNVSGLVKQIAQQYHTSPAVAGFILSRSVDQNKNWYQRGWDNLKGIVGGGDGLTSHIDWDQVGQLGKLAGNRDALLRQLGASTINDASTALAASASQAASAAQAQVAARVQAAQRLGRKIDVSGAITQALTAQNTRSQALDNAGAVTAAGGRQPDQAPKIDQRAVPQQLSRAAAAPAARAQSYLLRQYQAMIPDKAGEIQRRGVARAFQQKFGISIDEVRKNPNAAWEAAKRMDNKAAELLKQQNAISAASIANFRR